MSNIAIRVDGNKEIGLGHMSRCLTIAEQFKKNNYKVFFIVSKDSNISLISKEYNVIVLNNTTYYKWDETELYITVNRYVFDYLLIDSYYANDKAVANISKNIPIFYIDDNYDVNFNVTGIINYNVESTFERYKKREGIQYYLGTKYFPLNNKFLIKKQIKRERKSVLITSGSTDNNHICYKCATVLSPLFPNVDFVILLGSFFDKDYVSKIKALESNCPNVQTLSWGDTFFKYLSSFDLVIGPGSTILYEALCLNVPCISYEFVDNHHLECVTLDSLDIVPFVGKFVDSLSFFDKLIAIFKKEIDEQIIVERKSKNASFMDIHGAERIFEAITQSNENNNQF